MYLHEARVMQGPVSVLWDTINAASFWHTTSTQNNDSIAYIVIAHSCMV